MPEPESIGGVGEEMTTGQDRDGAHTRERGVRADPEHILLAKRYEPHPVRHQRTSFPCLDPIVASGKNDLGEHKVRFKGLNHREALVTKPHR